MAKPYVLPDFGFDIAADTPPERLKPLRELQALWEALRTMLLAGGADRNLVELRLSGMIRFWLSAMREVHVGEPEPVVASFAFACRWAGLDFTPDEWAERFQAVLDEEPVH